MLRAAILASLLALAPISASAADSAPKGATKPARTCDPSKVHTGPRGGRYRLTKNCAKVYIRR